MIDETTAIITIFGVIQVPVFWFLSNINSKVTKLSNGCFARHIELAKREGQNEMTLKSLHERADRLEDRESQANARDAEANSRDR